jgi:hypothetical protein
MIDLAIFKAIPVSEIPGVITLLAARLLEHEPEPVVIGPEQDTWLTIGEAAREIHRSTKWLYRHRDLPFIKRISAKSLLVSRNGMNKWIERQRA